MWGSQLSRRQSAPPMLQVPKPSGSSRLFERSLRDGRSGSASQPRNQAPNCLPRKPDVGEATQTDRPTDYDKPAVRVTETTAHHRPGSERRLDGVKFENRQIGTLGRREPALGQDLLKPIA